MSEYGENLIVSMLEISDSESEEIRNQIAVHSKYLLDFEWSQDYRFVRLWDPRTKSLRLPADWKRRTNDILAANYIHALALYQGTGDDCLDVYGNTYEVKLTYVHSRDFVLGPRGGVLQRPATEKSTPKGIKQACKANFKVYRGTDYDHHNQTTAYVLMSEDHNSYITGYMMNGSTVRDLLTSGQKTSEDRSISLSQFQNLGIEIKSSVPSMGWESYYQSLSRYIAARDGLITGVDRDAAIESWLNLLPVKSS